MVFLTGCMPNKQVPEQWLQDKELVIQSLQDAHTLNAKLSEKIEDLDGRILTLENKILKQESKIAAMEAGLAKTKQASMQASRKSASSEKKKDLNKRLDDLSAKLNPSTKKDVNLALVEKNAYTAAYLALKSGRYDEASKGFESVVKEFPAGEYTDQAYY